LRYLIGLGNPLARDDGIGVYLIEHVVAQRCDDRFRAIDLGTNALNLIAYLDAQTEAILIVDAARLNQAPGAFRFFSPAEVESQKRLPGISTHEGDVLKVLDLAKAHGYPMPSLMIMGIEPQDMSSGMGLSQTLSGRLEEYSRAAIQYLLQM
jgi:hydrogenase maturation protease